MVCGRGLTRGASLRSGRWGDMLDPLEGREGGLSDGGCSFWAAVRSARPLTSTSTAAASPQRTARYLPGAGVGPVGERLGQHVCRQLRGRGNVAWVGDSLVASSHCLVPWGPVPTCHWLAVQVKMRSPWISSCSQLLQP